MTSYDWWRTVSLFLWLYNISATGMLLFYVYGICRLAESRFGGRTYPWLLLLFFLLLAGSSLYYCLSDSVAVVHVWYAVWPALAGMMLLVFISRVHRLMLGQ